MVTWVHVVLAGVQTVVTGIDVFPHVPWVHMVLPRVPMIVPVVQVVTWVSMVPMVEVVPTVAGTLVHVVVATGSLAGVHWLAVGRVGVWGEVGGAEGRQRRIGIMG